MFGLCLGTSERIGLLDMKVVILLVLRVSLCLVLSDMKAMTLLIVRICLRLIPLDMKVMIFSDFTKLFVFKT